MITQAVFQDHILDQLLVFNEYGITSSYSKNSVDYFVNQFWTSKQRQGNSLHEISYRACFKSELPRFFLERISEPGDVVHDPFMGRGTTPLEAKLNGRIPSGNDINPLSIFLIRPRMNPPSIEQISSCLDTIELPKGNAKISEHESDFLEFFHPKTFHQIRFLRELFLEHLGIGLNVNNPVLDWIRMVCLNRLAGHSSGFFSGRTLPPNQAVSAIAQRKINKKYGLTPPERDLKNIILRKSKSLLRDEIVSSQTEYFLSTGLAENTPHLKDSSVALVVTSPPFLDAVDYSSDNWMRHWFAGLDSKGRGIPSYKSVKEWQLMVKNVLIEQARILKPGGYLAFEVGEIRSSQLLLEELVIEASEGLAIDCLGVMINSQDFTKTSNIWGIMNGEKGTNTNRIILFKRKQDRR